MLSLSFSKTLLNSKTVDMIDFGEFNHQYVISSEGSRGGGIGVLINKYLKCDTLTEIC